MKLFLIDGHALIFKMYYAFLGRPMINGKGEDTSIVFGFTKYLLELISREKPSHIAVAFDPSGGTFRNRLYPEYKANRKETPQSVIDALEPLMGIVSSLSIPVLMVKGFEADDVIGTVAKRYASQDVDVYMVTPDKDYGQLIDSHIIQYRPGKSGSDVELYGVKELCDKYKVSSPLQIIDYLTLCGDSSDNVPGVQGIGPVGAAKLITKYGSVENIYSHLDELTDKQQNMFRQAEPHIGLSKTLVTIRTDVPVETDFEAMALSGQISGQIYSFIDYYEMRSLRRLVDAIWTVRGNALEEVPQSSQTEVFDAQECGHDELREAVAHTGKMAVLYDGSVFAVACGRKYCFAQPEDFKSLLEDRSVAVVGHGIKSLMKTLSAKGICVNGPLHDIELMHYVLNPERNHGIASIAKELLGWNVDENASAGQTMSLFDDVPEQSDVVSREAVAIYEVEPVLRQSLGEMASVYDDIEEPLLRVLYTMENNGVLIDLSSLSDFAESLRTRMRGCEQAVRHIAGNGTLNVASPKQIGELIYEQLKLDPKARRPGRGGWPTDEETLQGLRHRAPELIDAILNYRGTRKLLSTYIEPLPSFISPVDGRVHTTFNQALTSTGRLSSSNPNLQNIPVRTEEGKEIRKAFAAPDGYVIMSADYSQIELRLMAHFCGDEHMIAAYEQGQDVHKAMAAKIFGVSLEEVDEEQRRMAKTANFGIMYGISAFGLAQRLGVSRTEAAALIDDYYKSFPSIKLFIDKTVSEARECGYVSTLFGRRRYLPDINSGNVNLRAMSERNAVNAPIQGTAADIIKLAMIGVQRELDRLSLRSRMVLQIHDELLLEVAVDEIEIVKSMLVEQMEGVVSLKVPLTVECNYGKNWLEAH